MEFEFTGSIYVDEQDLEEMVSLCKNKGYTPIKAFCEVSKSWDDCDYYMSDYIEDDVVKEIERRLKEN